MAFEMSHMGHRRKYRLLTWILQIVLNNRAAFNHDQSPDAEAEYDRLRNLARQEAEKRNSCFQRVRPLTSCLST